MLLPSGLHADFCSDAEASLEALLESYPRAKFVGVELFAVDGDRSLGYADVAGGRIYLNAAWFARPRSVFQSAVVAAREVTPYDAPQWHGGIGGVGREFERLLVHEFGHLLAESVTGYRSFADIGFAAAIETPDVAVSGYALADADEWWSETFAALRMGGAASSQIPLLQRFLDGSS